MAPVQDDRGKRAAGSPVVLSDMPKVEQCPSSVTLSGPPVPPQGYIQLYSSDEWEEFILEWATTLDTDYVQIKRFGGAGDKGADIAAFKTSMGLEGAWDCFQGKHYSKVLSFSDAAPEILKVFSAVLSRDYVMPDSYNFLAPKGCGTQLNQLLSKPTSLKQKFISQLVPGAALTKDLSLDEIENIKALASSVDFSAFKSVELLDALNAHSKTRYYAARFGAALKARPQHEPPPEEIGAHETRYIEQLVSIYREKYPDRIFDFPALATDSVVSRHFRRQRSSFYKAESLRLYARDSVPPGTFEKLQEDIYSGVIEIAETDFEDGYSRLAEVLTHVSQIDLNRHRLISVSDNDDRKGICHQLANEDRLVWVIENDQSAQ
jgi:hypothetical protein